MFKLGSVDVCLEKIRSDISDYDACTSGRIYLLSSTLVNFMTRFFTGDQLISEHDYVGKERFQMGYVLIQDYAGE